MIAENQVPPILPTSASLESTVQTFSFIDKNSHLDEHFPLWTQLFKEVHLPIVVVYPFLMVFFIQVLLLALWPWTDYWMQEENYKIMRWIRTVLFFLPVPSDPNEYLYPVITIFGFNLISIILVKIQNAYYKTQRKFISSLYFPIRTYFETLMVPMIVPTVVYIGELFQLISNGNHNASVIAAFIITIFNEFYIIYTFIIIQYFGSVTIYVNVSPLNNFDPTFIYLVTIGVHVSAVFYFLFNFFENWSFIVVIVLHAVMFIYIMIFLMRNITFVNIFVDSSGVALFLGCLAGDFFGILCYFKNDINCLYVLLIPLFIFGVSLAFIPIYFVLVIRDIKKKMNEVKPTQEEASQYFDDLGLGENQSKVLLYLRISFCHYCKCFYNFQLIEYIYDRYDSEKAIRMCLFFTNFFPKEFRWQNKLQKKLMKLHSLNFNTRYMLYQIESIKTFRQLADNGQARLKLIELRNLSRQVEHLTLSGLDERQDYKDYYESLAKRSYSTRCLWKEALEGNPNNPKFCEEYCRYLIEAECDFPEAIRIKNRQMNLELGHIYSVDNCFRSMIHAFPRYLIDKIVDFNGKIIKNDQQESGRSTGEPKKMTVRNESSNSSFGSSEFEIDNELEEMIGGAQIKLSRARLALHRLLDSKLPKSITLIKTLTVLLLAYLFGIFAFGFIFSEIQIHNHVSLMNQLDFISSARFYSAISNIAIMSQYFKDNDGFNKYAPFLKSIADAEPQFQPVVNLFNFTLPLIVNYTNIASEMFMKLIRSFSNQAWHGENVYKYLDSLIQPNYDAHNYFIHNYQLQYTQQPTSLGSLYAEMFTAQRLMSGLPTAKYINYDVEAAELLNNFEFVFHGSIELFGNISLAHKKRADVLSKIFYMFMICIPTATFIILDIPPFVLHIFTLLSLKRLHQVLDTIDQKSKEEAKEPIMINFKEDNLKFADNVKQSGQRVILMLINLFWSLFFFGLVIGGCFIAIDCIQDLVNLNDWNQFACRRLSLSAESLNTLLICVIMTDLPQTYPEQYHAYFQYLANDIVDKFFEADQNLISGTNDSKPCQGFDKVLDEYNVYDAVLNGNTSVPYEYYKNASIHQQIGIYRFYAKQILFDMSASGSFNVSDVGNAIFISNYILFHRLKFVADRILYLCQKSFDTMNIRFVILAALMIFGVCGFLGTQYHYYNNRVATYRGGLTILKRINPYTLLNNKMFNKLFLKDDIEEKGENLSIEALIVKNSNVAIFCTNIYGIVETANNATSTLLGYTPEQILGQNITSFFGPDHVDKLNEKIDQIRNRQASQFYEDDYEVTTDASKTVPVHTMIIGMKSGLDSINSFVFIVRDDSRIVEQKRQAEEEKAKSEKLLFQILPRDIVYKINRGEKDISFQVQSASIIFIDINKFSEYAANLTPRDIMSNLSYYFSELDRTVLKYNMLTKIKLIGDIFMGACGIFNQDDHPENHADQTILFALDVLYQIDEINKKLDSSLGIRIGINSGGPLIAGVLGKDKPLFDIIGDPINVAARLQSTSAVNKIHISTGTYELIKNMSYDITERGETHLKGKGTQKTYYVGPPQILFSATASIVMK